MRTRVEPRQLGKYRIEATIGRGGMGTVYRALDTDIHRTVALKLLNADLIGCDDCEDMVRRFKQEAQLAARCLHPNIVTIFDYGLSDSQPFIVMEFVDGIDLRSLLKAERAVPVRQAADIVVQVLEALQYAHGRGVVHRDIKPANVMLLDNGRVKVTDFGVAKLESAHLTRTGYMVGTPMYMSPEASRGGAVDGRADLYSVGQVLLELIAGEPLTEVSPDLVRIRAMLGKVVRERAVLDSLVAVIAKAMAMAPRDRFQTADEFAAQLKAALSPESLYVPSIDDIAVTVVRVRRDTTAARPREVSEGASQGPASATVSAEVFTQVQAALASYIGPLSRVLVNRYSGTCTSVAELIMALARHIPAAEERRKFIRRLDDSGVTTGLSLTLAPEDLTAAPRLSGTVGPAAGMGTLALLDTDMQRIARELAYFVGPIAARLVAVSARQSGTLQDLYTRLAANIPSEPERREFLRRLGA